MTTGLENQEYHFIVTNVDNSKTYLIAPDDEIYQDTIIVLKEKECVANFFVIKGNCVFNSDLD